MSAEGTRREALDALLRPRSIAILGASEDFAKINGRPLKFLLDTGYPGRIFPVNPKYPKLAGLDCFPDVASIPGPVDLAIVALPATAVLDAVARCAEKGVRAAVVFSSGFGEMGEEGRRLEQKLGDLARRTGLVVCGPNTLGFMNTLDRVMATFSQAADGETPAGPVAFVTQSGAFGTAIFALARQRGISFGYFVNSGNETDAGFSELLGHVVADTRVTVASGYIEGLKDGRSLLATADRALEAGKPVVIVKVGRSSAGARAAMSHTGSLAGSDRVYSGVFRQKGIVRADQEEELLDLVSAFSLCPLPEGRGIGLVTQSGGAGVLMADRAEQVGLVVPELAEETRAALRKVVPPFGSVKNPVDITAQFIADPGLLRASLEIVLEDPRVDAAIFYLGLMDRFADQVTANIREVHRKTRKPLVVAWAAAPERGLRALRESGICALPSAVRAVNAVRGLVEYAEARRRWQADGARPVPSAPGRGEAIRAAAEAALARGRRALDTRTAASLLEPYGVRFARAELARTADEAAAAAAAIGYPVALKLESPAVQHKTEIGGVRLDLADAAAVRAAFGELVEAARRHRPDAEVDGVLVQEMVRGGVEVVVGVHQDPQFGPVVMAGLGGVLVEALEDVAFRAAPVGPAEADAMLRELRGYRILEGVRGRPRADIGALVDLLTGVSRFAVDAAGSVSALDLNPLVVLPEGRGVVAVDVLAVVGP